MPSKIVIGTKQGKSLQKEISDEQLQIFVGRKIGHKVTGEEVEFPGYEFVITGGSDIAGTPMRGDIEGSAKKQILCVEGIGIKRARKGIRQRKRVCGNTVSDKISQINLKITKEGSEPLIKEEAKAEEKKE